MTLRELLTELAFDWKRGVVYIDHRNIRHVSTYARQSPLLDEGFKRYGDAHCPRFLGRDDTALYLARFVDDGVEPERIVYDAAHYRRGGPLPALSPGDALDVAPPEAVLLP